MKNILNRIEVFCVCASILIYANTFQAGFVFDDNRAIVENTDLLPSTPLFNLLVNDFWGTPLHHTGSHGSFRPLTVLTFRINYALFGLNPGPYHVTNVLLHALATYLFCYVVRSIVAFSPKKALLAGLLFALHPIHTEAVAGVVGRSDILATIFCLTALVCYSKACNHFDLAEKPSHDNHIITSQTENITVPASQLQRYVRTLSYRANSNMTKKKRKIKFNKRKQGNCNGYIHSQKTNKMKEKESQSNCLHLDCPNSTYISCKTVDVGFASDASYTTTDTNDDSLSSSTIVSENDIGGAYLPALDIAQKFTGLKELNGRFEENTSDGGICLENTRLKSVCGRDLTSLFLDQNVNATLPPFDDQAGKASKEKHIAGYLWLISCFGCATFALLSKEQGYCTLPICIGYHLWIRNKLGAVGSITALFTKDSKFEKMRLWFGCTLGFTIALVVLRIGLPIALSGGEVVVPTFSPSDNPAASRDDFLSRVLTFNYLLFCNLWLLIFPKTLSFDWSMDAIPLVENFSDTRNLLTLSFFAYFIYVIKYLWNHLRQVDAHSKKAGCIIFPNCSLNEKGKNVQIRRASSSSDDCDTRRSFNDGTSSSMHPNIQNTHLAKSLNYRGKKRNFGITELSKAADNIPVNTFVERVRFEPILLGTAIMCLSFLPATNLFFYVGFVLAERLLYLPSVGFCIVFTEIIFSQTFEQIPTYFWRKTDRRSSDSWHNYQRVLLRFGIKLKWTMLVLVVCAFATKTWTRNRDWKDEMSLYSSGIHINRPKALGNLGNALREQGQHNEAEVAYLKALEQRYNMADVHYNLGLLYQETGRHKMAEKSYRMAIKFKPRLAVAYLNLGVVVASQGRKQEAKMIYRQTAALDGHGLKNPKLHLNCQISALYNLGCELADEDNHKEAVAAYLEAIKHPLHHYKPHSLFNMLGQSLFHLGRMEEAEQWYQASLSAKPDHVPTFLTYSTLLARMGAYNKAEECFTKALTLQKDNKMIYQHYGAFLSSIQEYDKATRVLDTAIVRFGADDYSLVLAAASAHRQKKSYERSEKYYRIAVQLEPSLSSAHMNLGAILHLRGRYLEAKECYLKALNLKPEDALITENLTKLQRVLTSKPTA